jgi:hypothetical protein
MLRVTIIYVTSEQCTSTSSSESPLAKLMLVACARLRFLECCRGSNAAARSGTSCVELCVHCPSALPRIRLDVLNRSFSSLYSGSTQKKRVIMLNGDHPQHCGISESEHNCMQQCGSPNGSSFELCIQMKRTCCAQQAEQGPAEAQCVCEHELPPSQCTGSS